MTDLPDHPRLFELLEKRLDGALSAEEAAELEALLDETPGTRAAVAALAPEQVQASLDRAIDAAVERFDFAKARAAIHAKLAADRRWMWIQAAFGGAMILVGAVPAAVSGRWDTAAVLTAAALMPVLLWLRGVSRQRTLVAESMKPGSVAEVYQVHLHRGRAAYRMMQICMIAGGIGMLVLLSDGLMHRDFYRVGTALFVLAFNGPIAARNWFGRRAAQRYERYLAGELTFGEWLGRKDRSP